MARSKWKYFIGVYEGNNLKYVTESNNANKVALWMEGQKAKEFSLTTATDLCEGLNMNFITAVVIKAPSYMELTN